MRQALLSIVTMLLCGGVAKAAVDPKPKVMVVFVIDAGAVGTDLAATRAAAIGEVQNAVQAVLAERFPYFRWVTSGDAAHTLTLTLRERQSALDVEHVLAYTGSFGAGPAPLHVVYPWDNPPPDPKELKTDLVNRVRDDVAKSGAQLQAYFVSHLPLVKRVDVEERFIVLPVADVDAEAALFVVEFAGGRIRLKDPLAAPDKGIYCAIENFMFPPLIDAQWDAQIPTVMREHARNVEVKVKEFTPKAHANTSNGSVTSLPGGTP